MSRYSSFLPLPFVIASALLVVRTEAATVIYLDKALFLSNLAAGTYEETFTGGGGLSASQVFSGGAPTVFTYTISTTPSSPNGVYRNDSLLSTSQSTTVLNINLTSGNVYGIGGNFFKTNISDTFQSGQPVSITLNDGTNTIVTPTSINDFVGFVSDVPITSVSVASSTPLFSSVDNLVVGAQVPEPGLLALLGSGIVLCLRRRKNTSI